jgi:penicillin V acylase-like amidase (Ntn superfamily)
MQYQLDSFATVGEVIDHLDDLRPDGEGWHYLVADAEGGGAVIEYRGGEPLIYRGDDLPVWAISNTSYTQGLSHLPMDRAFGGKIDIAAGDDAYGRFLRMTILLESYETLDVPGSDYAFAVLDSVGSELTRRSVVYDGPSGRIMWRTKSNPSVRWLDLASIDFSADQPTRFVDIESKGSGDVSDEIVAYTTEANRRLVRSVLGLKASDRVRSLLSERGLTYEEALELIALHPTRQTASSAPD